MKKYFIVTVLVLCIISSTFIFTACDSYEDVLGTYSSPNNGTIQITDFDYPDGEFIATNIVLPRLNNGEPYTTASGDVELFTVYRQVGNVYRFRVSIDGVAYIGEFDSSTYILTVENITFEVQQ